MKFGPVIIPNGGRHTHNMLLTIVMVGERLNENFVQSNAHYFFICLVMLNFLAKLLVGISTSKREPSYEGSSFLADIFVSFNSFIYSLLQSPLFLFFCR